MYLYGKNNEALLKGKTTRDTLASVGSLDMVPLPPYIFEALSSVTLYIDMFYIQGMAFFHSISKHFFCSVELITSNTTRRENGGDKRKCHLKKKRVNVKPRRRLRHLYIRGTGSHRSPGNVESSPLNPIHRSGFFKPT